MMIGLFVYLYKWMIELFNFVVFNKIK